MSVVGATSEPLLRTLAPALRNLERHLRRWLEAPRRYPCSTILQATLEGLATDLHRQAEALEVERPLLVVMLMGGTGVGKSTLLNALAGSPIATASLARPTTRDPVVYYHESIRTDRLDPALRQCRLASHNRPALEQKVLVDTPDLDSNDLANRDKLRALLPVADVVLYVGSQEKYHDRLGWELFKQCRRRRAFAFVLNKWDRCAVRAASGLRPDEDLLRDLQMEGFENPRLFRTCARYWAERADGHPVTELPRDEQFPELLAWLEEGLTRLEIEAIKARGVQQLLEQLLRALQTACPPDLGKAAAAIRASWEEVLTKEAAAVADILLNTLEPYQREIEHHFTLEGQRRFHGAMGVYLALFNKLRYFGSSLRDRLPLIARLPGTPVPTPATWDLAAFTRGCTKVAGERHLDARGKALVRQLLLEADRHGFPLELLSEATEAVAVGDWRQRYAQDLIEALNHVEQQWSRPTGSRRLVQTGLAWLANGLPPVVFLASCVWILWRFFDPAGRGYQVQLLDLLLPFVLVLIVLIMLHVLIAILLPLRWPTIRAEFSRRLERLLTDGLIHAYAGVPSQVAELLQQERQQVERLQTEVREVAEWLAQREHAANVANLYGN
ncbi:MAG: 50S ribosome-binding GTPase [Gemmataceae bacterium]|nr:50S ribosome-binding GTPase [Gemmataceae bacterium]MDW8265717.1 GTPase [Gemmataceae bacterium]